MAGVYEMTIFRIFIPIFTVLVVFSSIILGHAINNVVLTILAIAFLASIYFEEKSRYLPLVQIILLASLHWVSQLNWALSLYFLMAGKELFRIQKIKSSIIVSMILFLLYTGVRMTYQPGSSYDYLVTISDGISFLFFTWLIYYTLNTTKQKRELQKENQRLLTIDTITGLINYQECHKRVQALVDQQQSFTFCLIDCMSYKSINKIKGYEGINQILFKMAEQLIKRFPNALFISRYGGDEFVLVCREKPSDALIAYMNKTLEENIPKEIGLKPTYGFAQFPEDGSSKDEIIAIAEANLITKKRQIWLEEEEDLLQSEKLKVIGELAAGMAHEIRNPITTVQGFLQISKDSKYNIEPWYHLLLDEITRVKKLTNEFLHFSKPQPSQLKQVFLNECIERVVNLVESERMRLGHQVKYFNQGSHISVLADKDKLIQVLINIVKNGLEAMEEEGLITIQLLSDKNHAYIEIQDTGCGIPENELKEIFDPFFTTKVSGTGLGLAICKKIIQDFGGTIAVRSVVDKGTIFKIELPLYENMD